MPNETVIYSKFVATLKNGEDVSFRIQNLTEDRSEEVVSSMLNQNLNEEMFVKAAGISKSIEAVTEIQKMYYHLTKSEQHPCLICCVDDEKAKLAGFNLLYMDMNNDEIEDMKGQFTSPEMHALFGIIMTLQGFCSPFDKLEIDVYLGGAGLFVDPEYRGCGIATELLKARKALCEELNVPVTGAWFTGSGSQRAAEKAGYGLLGESSYERLAEETGLVFENAPEFCKLMILKIDDNK